MPVRIAFLPVRVKLTLYSKHNIMMLTRNVTIVALASLAFSIGGMSAQEIRVDLKDKGHDVDRWV